MIKPLQSITLKNDNGEDTTYVVATAPAIVETTEPAGVASFSDGAEGIPVKALIADINPVQSGSGDPSPSNVRPITGWTGMNVVRTGKNLLDPSKMTENVSTRKRWYWTDGFVLKANKTYTFSVTGQDGATAYIFAMDGTTLSSGVPSTTYTPTADTTVRFQVYRQAGIADSATYQLEVGSSATTYAPYNGTTYPISWQTEAGTVYGGTLDVTNGVLTVDRVIEEYDGTEDWKKSSTYNGSFYLNTGTQHSLTNYPICSHATYNITFPTGYAFGKFGFDGTGKVNLNVWIAAAGTSLNDFKAYLAAQKTANTPLQVLTYLATPQTYQLTPQAVLTILGQNNIWADTGDVEVDYCADTKMYIAKVIAEL